MVRETVVLSVCWEQIIVLGIVARLQLWALHLAVVWQLLVKSASNGKLPEGRNNT
jgi:hypothetical protein